MSEKVFQQAFERLKDGWSMYNVHQSDFTKALRQEFWFEWLPQKSDEELVQCARGYQDVFEDGHILEGVPASTITSILMRLQPEEPLDGFSWEDTPLSEYVGYALESLMEQNPSFLPADAFAEHEMLGGVHEFLCWKYDMLDEEKLSDQGMSWLALMYFKNSDYKQVSTSTLKSKRFITAAKQIIAQHDSGELYWPNIEPYLDGLDASRMLALCHALKTTYHHKQPLYAVIKALLTPCFPEVLPLYEARYTDSDDRKHSNAMTVTMAMVRLCQEHDQNLSDAHRALFLEVLERGLSTFVEPLKEILSVERIEGTSEALSGTLERWRSSLLAELFEFVDEQEHVLSQILEKCWGYKLSKYDVQSLTRKFRLFPEELLTSVAITQWGKSLPPKEVALALFDGLRGARHTQLAELYILGLAHKSKPVRESAEVALRDLGELARPALESNKDAKKKAVREVCQAQLAALDATSAEPELTMSDEEVQAHRERMEKLEGVMKNYSAANRFLRQIQSDRLLWFEAACEIFAAQAPAYYAIYTFKQSVYIFHEHIEAPVPFWSTCFSTLAHLHAKLRAYEKREMIKLFSPMPMDMTEEVMLKPLRGATGTLAPELLEFYIKRSESPDLDVLINHLQHKSKPARQTSMDALKVWFERADEAHARDALEKLVSLVTSKQKHTRELTSQLLATLDAGLLEPHIKLFEKARDKERSADVLNALDTVLRKSGQGSEEQEAESFSADATGAWKEAEALLESQRARKVPSFIKLEELPDLLWSETDKPLSDKAMKGLLTTLRQEGPDSQDAIARQIRPLLDDESAHAFSVALKDQWMKAGAKASHKWAPYQQGIFVKEARLNEFGPHLAEWVSLGRRAWAQWYMDVLARHGSMSGKSWVVHWSLVAPHKSLHTHAIKLVEELAKQEGVTPGKFAESVNLYIEQDVYEEQFPTNLIDGSTSATLDNGDAIEFVIDPNHELMIKRKTGKLQKSLPKNASRDLKDRFKKMRNRYNHFRDQAFDYLESCMISGRPWEKKAFEAFFLEHPVISRFAPTLLFLLDSGELFHINEGDIVDVEWEPMTLPEGAKVKIAHVFDLKDKNVDKWLAHMGEAEIVQPFAQLDRPFYVLGEEPEISKVQSSTLAGRLQRSGWRNAAAEDAGMIYEASRIMPGRGVRAVLDHNGFYAGNPGAMSQLTDVRVSGFYDLQGRTLRPENVDAIAYSETWVALVALTQ